MRIIAGTAANMGIDIDPPILEPKNNARTADKAGYIIPVEITVFDVSFVLSLLQILSFCLIKLKKSNICGGNWLSKMCFAMFMCIWY
jgi:ribosomal protein L11